MPWLLLRSINSLRKRLAWRALRATSDMPLFLLVQFLQHRHRNEHVVFLEAEQGGGIVQQHVGIQRVDALV